MGKPRVSGAIWREATAEVGVLTFADDYIDPPRAVRGKQEP